MDFIFTLQPFDDESLISYLYRHSAKNNYPVEWIFSELYFRVPDIKYNLINLRTLDIRRISKAINLEPDALKNMTYGKYNINDNLQLLNLKNSRYCPHCLKEDSYYRLYWDLNPIKICMKHKTFLLETCENCGDEVSVLDIVSSSCRCGNDLSEISNTICDEVIINQQTDLLEKIGISLSNGNILSNGEYNQRFVNSLYKLVNFIKRFRCQKPIIIFKFAP